MRWVEMKCKCEVWSAGCEECSAKSEESAHLALHCTGVARRSCSTAWLSMSNLTGLLAALHCLFKAWYNAFGRGAVMCNRGPACSLPQLTTTSHDIATIQTQHGQHPKVRLSNCTSSSSGSSSSSSYDSLLKSLLFLVKSYLTQLNSYFSCLSWGLVMVSHHQHYFHDVQSGVRWVSPMHPIAAPFYGDGL